MSHKIRPPPDRELSTSRRQYRQRRGRGIHHRDVYSRGAFRLAVLLQGKHGEVMRSSGRKRDAGVYRSTRPLIDERIVPEDLHGADGSAEAGGDRSSHLYGRSDGGVVVGSGDDHAAGTGEGGGQIIGSSVPMLEEGDGAGRKDEKQS